MSKLKFEAVLLDLDGTLVDAFTPIIAAMQQTLQAFDLPMMSDNAIRRHTGRGDCSMTALFGDAKEDATRFFIEVHDQTYLNDIQPMPGSEVLLDYCKQINMPMAVVTSKGQHRAEAQLDMLGWLPYFDSIIGKLDGRASKPNPEPLLLACADLSVNPERAVMIGDGEADVKAAARAGCLSIGLTHSFTEEELKKSGASVCFKSLNEALEWLK
ncbi:MAG TPA: HAD family hydrolase [Mariprofundaceae bacterium]|nr:HAD family hydrolase [Mariprofundaceae bacterium]